MFHRPRLTTLLAVGVGLASGVGYGCFNGNQLAGLPCQSDDDCGPNLFCVGQPGQMICDEDPDNPTTDDVGDETGTESGSSDDATSDETDTTTDETDTDTTDGECQQPSGVCESSSPAFPQPTTEIHQLITAYCQVYTGCDCPEFDGNLEACINDFTVKFQMEQTLADNEGAMIQPECVGWRIAFLQDLGCRPDRGVNPPLATIQACDWRNCPIWSGASEPGADCGNGNTLTSNCIPPNVCDNGTCIDLCGQGMPPIWTGDPMIPESMCGFNEVCSVCDSCQGNQCGNAVGEPCTNDSQCGVAGFCNDNDTCEPRHLTGECCLTSDQCLSDLCDDGVCLDAPFICTMPFPTEFGAP